MATAEEGGATARITTTTSTTSSYGGGGGGGGAGGKFRKKPFRKPTTPYDRPPVALRRNDSNGGWLKKLVVDPASRLISYGAHRFFASVFRRRLPPPPAPLAQEPNHVRSDGLLEAVSNNQYGARELAGGECGQPISSSDRKGICELEQLLKQKTFTRSEIDHLTELLHSRGGEVSLQDDGKRIEDTALDFGRRQQFESCSLEANRNEGGRSHGVVSTPISNSKVLESSIASPAELAKAYMGSRPSKVSPSMLGKHSQVTVEDTRLLNNMRFASKSPIMSLTTKGTVGPRSPGDGFITTPGSRSRLASYNMSRSLYSKESGINHNGYAGLTMPSASLSSLENTERSEPKSMSLKRRSYVLDDEVGSVGPIRRIRQKSNLIGSGIPHAGDRVRIDSGAVLVSSKQKLPLIGDAKHVQKTVEENADNSVPSTSYAQFPSKSSEVASRILQHLEKMTPKAKSSGSKLVTARDKSPFKLTPSMLRGQALRSMEDLSSSELLLNVQDDQKFESGSNATSPDAHDSTSQEQGKDEKNGSIESCIPSDTCYPVMNCDSALSLKASEVRDGTSDSVVENGVSQPLNGRAFRMSALEDYVELDDDLNGNGLASQPASKGRGPMEAHLADSNSSPADGTKLLKTTIQPEVKSPSGLISSKTSYLSVSAAGAASVGEGRNGIATPALVEVTAGAQSSVLPPPSVAAFDKPEETNNPPPLFSFSSKVPDALPSLTPELSSRMLETKPESSSSLLNISAPTGSLVKIPEPEKDGHPKPQAAEDRNEESNTVPSAASNGALVSSASADLFTAASSNSTNHISTDGPVIFTPSTSAVNSTTSGGSIFGPAAQPTSLGEPVFRFGASADAPATMSAASTAIIPAEGNLKTKAVIDPSSGSSSTSFSNVVAFGVAASGSLTSGLSSSASDLSANNLQISLFNSASKSSASAVGTVPQGTSVRSVSFASLPTLNTNSSPSFVSSSSSSQAFNPITSFGFNSSASSSETGAIVPSSRSTSSVFGVNSTAVSNGSAGSSSSFATPSMFSFGSNSSSTNAVGSTGGPAPVFGFDVSSSVSASVTTTSSCSSSSSSMNAVGSTGGSTSPVFSFGATSSVSASVTTTTSSFSNSSSSTDAVGTAFGATPPVFSFGASSSASASVANTTSSFSSGTSSVFTFGGSSSASSSATNLINCASAPSDVFGSSWQTPNSSIFGSTFTSTSLAATGFAFGASSTSSAASNAAPVVFNSSAAPSSSSPFPFTTSSASVLASPSPSLSQPVFGNPTSGFAASPGNNDQMNAEDSMAEDPVQSAAPSVPVFGHTSVSPSPSGFMFGSTVPSQPNPFQFGGHQNQVAPQNTSMFQASGSLEFSAGGSFSLGSGGGDKSGRKYVKINRNKNRKK